MGEKIERSTVAERLVDVLAALALAIIYLNKNVRKNIF